MKQETKRTFLGATLCTLFVTSGLNAEVAIEKEASPVVEQQAKTKQFSCQYGISSIKGKRFTMEDAHCCITNVNGLMKKDDGIARAYFGVYDGHGGRQRNTVAIGLHCEQHGIRRHLGGGPTGQGLSRHFHAELFRGKGWR